MIPANDSFSIYTRERQRRNEVMGEATLGVLAIVFVSGGLVCSLLNEKKGPESPVSGAPISVPSGEHMTPSSTNEEIFALFQEKIKKDPNYKPTRTERIALAKLGIAVNDGEPIPFEGDGKEEQK